MDISKLGINTPVASSSGSSDSSGSQSPASPVTQVALTQLAQAQLAQAQLTCSSTSTSPSTTSPLTMHLSVVTYPPSSGSIQTFFQAMKREIKNYLKEPLPYGYRPSPEFDKPGFCKPGFETFNKFIQLNKQYYELGKQFFNDLGDLEKLWFICQAAQRGCAALLKLAKQCGMDLNQEIQPATYYKDSIRGTPLSIAIYNDDVRAVGALLSIGVDPNRRDRMGYTPFIAAIHPSYSSYGGKNHTSEIVQLLIQHGADINARVLISDPSVYNIDQHGMTALMICRSDFDKIKQLLNLGVDNEVCTFKGETVLTLLVDDAAHHFGSLLLQSYIECLIGCGANIFVKNHAGDNLLTIAAAGHRLGVVPVLLRCVNLYIDANLPGASEQVRKTLISTFLEARNGSGKTALMVAVEKGSPHIALELINGGANLEASIMEDNTPKTVWNMIEDKNEHGLWDDVLFVARQRIQRQ